LYRLRGPQEAGRLEFLLLVSLENKTSRCETRHRSAGCSPGTEPSAGTRQLQGAEERSPPQSSDRAGLTTRTRAHHQDPDPPPGPGPTTRTRAHNQDPGPPPGPGPTTRTRTHHQDPGPPPGPGPTRDQSTSHGTASRHRRASARLA